MVGERGSVKRQADNQNKNGKASLTNKLDDYVIRVLTSPQELDAVEWNDLLAQQDPGRTLNPFMRHEYLAAMQASGSAVPATGWAPPQVDQLRARLRLGGWALDNTEGRLVIRRADEGAAPASRPAAALAGEATRVAALRP